VETVEIALHERARQAHQRMMDGQQLASGTTKVRIRIERSGKGSLLNARGDSPDLRFIPKVLEQIGGDLSLEGHVCDSSECRVGEYASRIPAADELPQKTKQLERARHLSLPDETLDFVQEGLVAGDQLVCLLL
jgi:hypothetical protein